MCQKVEISRDRTISENSALYDRMVVTSICEICGQFHENASPHLYDYFEPVDSNLQCNMCRQPLVDPIESNCGHTYCSKCLKNHLEVQAICPIDQIIINYIDCKRAPLIVRRLLDKLKVVCPNVDYCEEVLPRNLLHDHLKLNCRGAVMPCINAKLGCVFQGSRNSFFTHQWECKFKNMEGGQDPIVNKEQDFNCMDDNTAENGSDKSYVKEVSRIIEGKPFEVELTRQCGCELGFSFVGGVDTSLGCTVIQEIYFHGLIYGARKCRPGDQILEVNGFDLTSATHIEAKNVLTRFSSKLKLRFLREATPSAHEYETFSVTLLKRNDSQLGLVLESKMNGRGIYIRNCIPGTEASNNGLLSIEDRILKINEADVRNCSHNDAVKIIKDAVDQVTLVIERVIDVAYVVRHSEDKRSLVSSSTSSEEAPRRSRDLDKPSPELSRGNQNHIDHYWLPPEGYESGNRLKRSTVQIHKYPSERLAVTVAGGRNSAKGDIPIFITCIHPHSVLRSYCQIKNGTILVAINDRCLLDLSHESAVETISQESQGNNTVNLEVLEGPETCSEDDSFIPSWKYWLQLPLFCATYRNIELKKENPTASLGFSVSGGVESCKETDFCRTCIMIRTIVPGSVAYNNGRLRCGDILVEVDGNPLVSVTLSFALACLKRPTNRVSLKVVSWPGTIV